MKIISLFTALLCTLTVSVFAQNPKDLRTYGNTKAPYQMYLFTSLTCPHCADFHQKVFPEIEKKYIKQDRAKLMVVDLAIDKNGFWGSLALRCVPEKNAPSLEDKLYDLRSKWSDKEQVEDVVKAHIKRHHLSQKEFNLCISDPTLKQAVMEQHNNLSELYGIQHMPTLVLRHGNEVHSWEGSDVKVIMGDLRDIIGE